LYIGVDRDIELLLDHEGPSGPYNDCFHGAIGAESIDFVITISDPVADASPLGAMDPGLFG